MRIKKEILIQDGIEYIVVPLLEYNKLVKDQEFLDRLHANGVDNWDWYSECLEEDEK